MYCACCGAQLEGAPNFCGECGEPIGARGMVTVQPPAGPAGPRFDVVSPTLWLLGRPVVAAWRVALLIVGALLFAFFASMILRVMFDRMAGKSAPSAAEKAARNAYERVAAAGWAAGGGFLKPPATAAVRADDSSAVLQQYLSALLRGDAGTMRRWAAAEALANVDLDLKAFGDQRRVAEQVVSCDSASADTATYAVEERLAAKSTGAVSTHRSNYMLRRTSDGWRVARVSYGH